MSADIIVERLRRLLIGLAVFLVVGTLGELLVIEHFQKPSSTSRLAVWSR